MEKIIQNKIRCKHCGDRLESKFVHDFKMCNCGACGIDGGLLYLRRIGTPDDYVELSIVENVPLDETSKEEQS